MELSADNEMKTKLSPETHTQSIQTDLICKDIESMEAAKTKFKEKLNSSEECS